MRQRVKCIIRGRGRGTVFGFGVALGGVLPWCACAALMTSFQGETLDANLHLDVPDSCVGTITLDTVNHNLRFQGPGADLWDARNGLPYAWTEIPPVAVGGMWRAETEVQFYGTSPSGRIVGLTTYSGPDGSGGASMGQEFTFGLDHWDGPNGVWVQGLGDNHPGDSDNLAQALVTDQVDLRMDVTVGALNYNTYTFAYKLPSDSAWTSLGTIHDVSANDRVALFFKGSDMDVSFNYFNVTEEAVVPEPASMGVAGLGAVVFCLARTIRRRRHSDAKAVTPRNHS